MIGTISSDAARGIESVIESLNIERELRVMYEREQIDPMCEPESLERNVELEGLEM